jgi:hypothetical protein
MLKHSNRENERFSAFASSGQFLKLVRLVFPRVSLKWSKYRTYVIKDDAHTCSSYARHVPAVMATTMRIHIARPCYPRRRLAMVTTMTPSG